MVKVRGKFYDFVKSKTLMETLLNDIEWMRKLPIFRQTDISHRNISTVLSIRNDEHKKFEFAQTLLWTREIEIDKGANIFNIYGYTHQKTSVEITEDRYSVLLLLPNKGWL